MTKTENRTDLEARTIDPVKFSLTAGSILMILPTFFWIGVMLEIFFSIPYIVTQVMLPIDRMSPLISVMIMVGLPLITLLLNLKTLMQFHMQIRPNNVEFDVRVNRSSAQWMLIIYSGISIMGILTYAFFENFKAFSLQGS